MSIYVICCALTLQNDTIATGANQKTVTNSLTNSISLCLQTVNKQLAGSLFLVCFRLFCSVCFLCLFMVLLY